MGSVWNSSADSHVFQADAFMAHILPLWVKGQFKNTAASAPTQTSQNATGAELDMWGMLGNTHTHTHANKHTETQREEEEETAREEGGDEEKIILKYKREQNEESVLFGATATNTKEFNVIITTAGALHSATRRSVRKRRREAMVHTHRERCPLQ